MTAHKITVLIAEDSGVVRSFLVNLLESDPRIHVVGAVADGWAAVEFVRTQRPDVVLMDINMPGMDGFEATRRIMESNPVPIVVCSAIADTRDVAVTFQAMEAGAVACIDKPFGHAHAGFDGAAAHLRDTVRLMSEVRVVRRTARRGVPAARLPAARRHAGAIRMVGIGASTGGPPVLQEIFAGLPVDFPVPILVVQHISRGFLAGMAQWLNETGRLPVHVGSHGTVPQPGHVYLAPDDLHMGVDANGAIMLTAEDLHNHVRPSVSFLFRTLSEACGAKTLGVLLTGMGRDGAAELKTMRERGAVTIAQDRESSVVHGMPGAAIALDAATHVLPADRIAAALTAAVLPGKEEGNQT